MNRLVIIGASGHGKVVLDIAKRCGYEKIVFLDDDETIKECAGYPVIGKSVDIPYGDLFVAVGNAEIRKRIIGNNPDRHFPILIHPDAVVAENVQIGPGTVMMAGTVINPGVQIGEGCIINTASSVDHDCIIENFCHVSVGAHLCGTVSVGELTWIGAGAIIKNNVNICGGCMVGAGAVVIKDIDEPGTYIGVPARLLTSEGKRW